MSLAKTYQPYSVALSFTSLREFVFSLFVAPNKVIKDKAANLDHLVLVTHLKRLDASVQQWEILSMREIRPE